MITTATSKELKRALAVTNKQYKRNASFVHIEPVGKRFSFRLRVKNSKGAGAKIGFTGRRQVAACWHLHRDFMKNLFEINNNIKLISRGAGIVYNGKEDFQNKFVGTGYKNIGSMFQPLQHQDACECGH